MGFRRKEPGGAGRWMAGGGGAGGMRVGYVRKGRLGPCFST